MIKSLTCFLSTSSDISFGTRRPILDRTGLAATNSLLIANGPECKICIQIFVSAFALCTASVRILCLGTWLSLLKIAPSRAPSSLGEIPPVIIRPTPVEALSAKYVPILEKSSCPPSSKPVCIDPIIILFLITWLPTTNGSKICLYISFILFSTFLKAIH